MKVLILGGTGAMGVHLVSLVANQASRVVVTSRSRSGQAGNVEYITGNAKDESFLANLLKQHWDVIIDFMVYSTSSFQERYKQLLNATGQYIYLSSARVYAESKQPITENSPRLLDVTNDQTYLATDEYALSKARQENLLFDHSQNNWTIIRPYITYSDHRLQLGVLEKEDWLYRALQGKTIVTSKDIQTKHTTLTFGEDVSRGILSILGKPGTQGEAFHITSGVAISWAEVLETYMAVLESHLSYCPKTSLQDLESFMKWRSGKYQIIYDRLYDRKFDNNKIDKYIDTSKFVTPQIGLAQCLEHFINAERQQFNSLNWKAEAIKDRMLHEHTSLAEISGLKQKVKYCLFRYLNLA